MCAFCVFQHALLLPVLVHHVRYHMCLQTLDEKMGYAFKDRSLLQVNYQLQNRSVVCVDEQFRMVWFVYLLV